MGTGTSLSTGRRFKGRPPSILGIVTGMPLQSALSSRSYSAGIRTRRPAKHVRMVIGSLVFLPLLIGEPVSAATGPGVGSAPSHEFTATSHGHAGAVMQLPVPSPPQVLNHFDPPEHDWSAGHRGVDLALDDQNPVLAPAQGTVTFVGHVVNRGVLVIEHPNGLRSSFEPIESDLAVGHRVAAGSVIGHLTDPTSAGHCSSSCLHWGVRSGDIYIDPMRLITGEPSVLFPLH